MDRTKPPGISFNDVILKDLTFTRKEGFSDKPILDVQLKSSFSISENNEELIYEMSCEIKDELEYFYIKCTMLGFFSVIKESENMSLKEYSDLNAPASMLPYIREVVASTTVRAGLSPIMIPPTNLSLLKVERKTID